MKNRIGQMIDSAGVELNGIRLAGFPGSTLSTWRAPLTNPTSRTFPTFPFSASVKHPQAIRFCKIPSSKKCLAKLLQKWLTRLNNFHRLATAVRKQSG